MVRKVRFLYMTHVYIQRVNHLKGAREGWEENRKDHGMALVSMDQKEWPETPSTKLYLLLPVDFCRGLLSSGAFSFAAVIRFLNSPKVILPLTLIVTRLHRNKQQHHALQVFSK